jgi:hypothetical protein
MRDDQKAAFRSLLQSPTFAAVAVAVLSVAFGSGTAVFSVVDAVVLRGLPFDVTGEDRRDRAKRG